MANNPFLNYVRYLIGIGKTVQQVYGSIKNNARYRSTSNRNIQNAIDTINRSRQFAKDFSNAGNTAPIKDMKSAYQQGGSKRFNVGFSFNFNFPSGQSKEGGSRRPVHLQIDIKENMTPADLKAAVREKMMKWIEEYYEEDISRYKRIVIKINYIQGV